MFASQISRLVPLLKLTNEVQFVPTIGSEEELLAAAYVAAAKDPSLAGRLVRRACRRKFRSLAVEAPDFEDSIQKSVYERHAFVKEGSLEQIEVWMRKFGGFIHGALRRIVCQVEGRGGYVVVIASNKMALGAVCFTGKPTRPRFLARLR